jgi:hypothetical protein
MEGAKPVSKQVKLSLASLAKLDMGKIDMTFSRHMQVIVRDCQSRPADKKARKVRLTLFVVPVADELGQMSDILISFKMANSMPDSQSKSYVMAARPDGAVIFNPDNPSDIRQGTLDLDGLTEVEEDGKDGAN